VGVRPAFLVENPEKMKTQNFENLKWGVVPYLKTIIFRKFSKFLKISIMDRNDRSNTPGVLDTYLTWGNRGVLDTYLTPRGC